MLSTSLAIPVLARQTRAGGPPPSPPAPVVDFPIEAFAYWEGQGQSNMTGFNALEDAPAALRVVNPLIEMMTDEPGWRPYALLGAGESQTVDGVLYEGKLDEAEIPAAAGGAGPLIGLHEAMLAGDMSGPAGLYAQGLLMAKFADAGKPLDEFSPDYDDGSAPLGGANFNARGVALPASLRARLAAGEALFHQGKIWMHGEANAALARAAADPAHVALTSYADGVARIRAFDRAQFGTPSAPWYMVAVAENDVYDGAINDALASLAKWRVGPDGVAADLGPGRDETSYVIDHMIQPAGADPHFSLDQMRAIGALVWKAHQHHVGAAHGLTNLHPILAISPVFQRAPEVVAATADALTVEAIGNEDGALHALALPEGAPAPAASAVVVGGVSAAGLRGRAASVALTGLAPEAGYDVWCVYAAASGDLSAAAGVSGATVAETPVAGWSPATPGAHSWWDAQDAATVGEAAGEVVSWADKSGGGATLAPTAASARPALNPAGLNGLPAIDFDGDDDLAAVGVGLGADMCLLVVAEVDVVTNGSEAILEFKTQNLAIRAQNNAEFRARYELMNGANTNISPSPVVDYAGAPHIFVSRYDSAADRVEVWIDGALVASQDTYAVDIAGPDELRVMRPFGTSLRLDGKVGEIAAIASADPADRERLEGYAAHRWGLAGALPADHPWKSAAP